jgi:alkylation response protein AidB-like acyl-CoA dehydrogenase
VSSAPKHATEQESRDVAEAAREAEWKKESFMRSFFEGRFRLGLLHPHPVQDPDEAARGDAFLQALEAFARDHIDGDAIDREGHVPEAVLDGLRELGAFGIKIPQEYGGLGLSQVTYNRALGVVAARCASTGAFLSAHQSIGVPQPLTLFGTEEQKQAYLPRLAAGCPLGLRTHGAGGRIRSGESVDDGEPAEDGDGWILNGEKLWCTNGPRSEMMVVMARTPAREGVRARKPITAFIVETDGRGSRSSTNATSWG